MQVHHRSLVERVIHAIGFEVIAVAICAPVGAWLLDRSILQMDGDTGGASLVNRNVVEHCLQQPV